MQTFHDKNNKILILIPSRLESKRLKKKSLRLILGKPMIVRVAECAKKMNIGRVVVAAGDIQIKQVLDRHRIESYLTLKSHKSGTDRINEIFENYFNNYNIIVNLQGDIPFFKKELLVKTISLLDDTKADIGTAAVELDNKYLDNSDVVKVKVDFKKKNGYAEDFKRNINRKLGFFHHVGIYVFRPQTLKKFILFDQTAKEKIRKLEQMRAIDNHMRIKVSLLKYLPIGVDTKKDLKEVRSLYRKIKQ